jgi:GxxExxY protein
MVVVMELHDLVWTVIGCAIEVHKRLGPGMLESAYTTCLAKELQDRGLKFRTEVPVPLDYKGRHISCAYRADFVIEGMLLLEIKCVERVMPVHSTQTISYLRLLDLPQALLFNFRARRLVDDLKSFVHTPRTSRNART